MGMSIDEQIKALEYLKECGIFPFSDTRTENVITDEYVDGAIDTMRKYQMFQLDYEARSNSLKSSDYIWLMMFFFAILFSDIGSIKLTKNEQNNIAMLMANTDILRGEEDVR